MRGPELSARLSRRYFIGLCGIGLMGGGIAHRIGKAAAQTPPKLLILPKAGNIRVAAVEFTINNVKLPNKAQLTVGIAWNHHACTLELSGGIHIVANVTLASVPGTQPGYFGRLGFLQLTHFKHCRSPSSTPNTNWDRASSPNWDLDDQYPYLNKWFDCAQGTTAAELSDDPGVPAEDILRPYETLMVEPADMFRTWLIWEVTDNNKPPTPANKPNRHVLGRVDWFWKGEAGDTQMPPAKCASKTHPGHAWETKDLGGGVSNVYVGAAAGVPPSLKQTPFANPLIWVPVPGKSC